LRVLDRIQFREFSKRTGVDAELQKGPVRGATERVLSTAGMLASAVDGGHGMTGGAKHVSSAAATTVRAGARFPCALGGGGG
jgi:hypothetical protein